MNWDDEMFVKLYTRDTTTWKMFGWQARCVLLLMLRKVDRSGVLEVGDAGVDGLAAHLELPPEVVRSGVPQLKKHGTIRQSPTAFVLPNFVIAQSARQTNRIRQLMTRERRRDEHLRVGTDEQNVTQTPSEAIVCHTDGSPRDVSAPIEEKRIEERRSEKKKTVAYATDGDGGPSPRVGGRKQVLLGDPDLQRALNSHANQYLGKVGKRASTPTLQDLKRLRELVREHGVDEVVLRVAHAFEHDPWPHGPWDLRRVLMHFDRLVPSEAPQRRTANGLVAGRHEPGDQTDAAHYRAPWEDD